MYTNKNLFIHDEYPSMNQPIDRHFTMGNWSVKHWDALSPSEFLIFLRKCTDVYKFPIVVFPSVIIVFSFPPQIGHQLHMRFNFFQMDCENVLKQSAHRKLEFEVLNFV